MHFNIYTTSVYSIIQLLYNNKLRRVYILIEFQSQLFSLLQFPVII